MSKPTLAFVVLSASMAIAAPSLAQDRTPTTVSATSAPYLTVNQLRAKYADPSGKIAKVHGVEIYYKDEGRGPVLLMVHGSWSSMRTYDRIATKLKSRYRVIRFDVAGMGLSGTISDTAAASVSPVDIVTGLLNQLSVKKLTYVGVSSGGTLGMFLAARRPDLVKRLILSNTPSDPVRSEDVVRPEAFVRLRAEARKSGFYSRAYFDAHFDFYAAVPARIDTKMRDEHYDLTRRVPEKHGLSMVAQIGDGIEADRLMKLVTAPTLLVWGGSDKLLTIPTMNSLARHLAKADVSHVILPDAGHYPPLEVPDRFAQIIAAYVEGATPE